MNIADPKYLKYLRDLPSSYLLDLIVDSEDVDKESILWVLAERGFSREDIAQRVDRRRSAGWNRPYRIWTVARWLTIFNALIVTSFNISGIYHLFQNDHAFKGPLLFLATGSVLCGFIVGYKLTTHIYHGRKAMLYCGFPFPVGYVELTTGEESRQIQPLMILNIALNAAVGASVTLFPLILIYVAMK